MLALLGIILHSVLPLCVDSAGGSTPYIPCIDVQTGHAHSYHGMYNWKCEKNIQDVVATL